MDHPVPRQRRYAENLFDPEPTFRLARPALPRRHRGLAPDAPLPPGADLGRLQALMREIAPCGWSTDPVALDRALVALLASLGKDATPEGGDSMSEVDVEPREEADEQSPEPESAEAQDQPAEDAQDQE